MLQSGVCEGVFDYADHGLYALSGIAQPTVDTVRALFEVPARQGFWPVRSGSTKVEGASSRPRWMRRRP